MRSGGAAKGRGPVSIARVVAELTMRRGLGQVGAAEQFRRAWEQLVGAELATQSRVASLSRGVLEVVVSGSVVLQELTFRKGELLQAIQSQVPGNTVRDIRFRVGTLD